MSVAVNDPWRAVRADLEDAAQDGSVSADGRIIRLKMFREDLNDMLGRVDSYIGDLELVRDGRDPAYRDAVMEARTDATMREQLLDRGLATPEELDAMGMISHDDLDKLDEESLLDVWLAPKVAEYRSRTKLDEASLGEMIQRLWDEAKHPRGAGGKFRDVLGRSVHPRGRHGRAVPIPKAKQPPGVPGAVEQGRDLSGRFPPRPHEPATRIDHTPPTAEQVTRDLERARTVGANDWPTKGDKATELLGAARDTQELHTRIVRGQGGTRVYTDERQALHDRIVDTLLRERMPVQNSAGEVEMHPNPDGEQLKPPEGTPRALFMAGGTASGKSTALALPENKDVQPEAAAHVDPDEIKAMLPEYVQMVQAGDRFAASGVHEESSDIAKRVLAEAMRRGLNVVRDGTGDSPGAKFAGQISDMARAGYEPHLLYVNAPTDTAIVRAASRAQRTGRWVPEQEIRSQHRNVSARFEEHIRPMVEDGTIKSISMYDTGDAPVRFAQGGDGSFSVLDQSIYDAFVAKKDEP